MPRLDGVKHEPVRTQMTFVTSDDFSLGTLDSGMEIVGEGADAYLALKEDPADTFATSGEWVSDIIDSKINDLDWMTAYGIVDYPRETTVLEVFVKVASDPAHFPYMEWGESIYNGAMLNKTGRYIQGKITMTGDGATTPIVHELQLRYDANPLVKIAPEVVAE